jgi:hypothetical protein
MKEMPARPPDYVPPSSSAELIDRYSRGERYFYLAECESADLSGLDLSGAHLGTCDFRGANLAGANLSGSFLGHARLFGANLQGANLREVRTFDTYFNGADLMKADFRDAELLRTEFWESCLVLTNFRNCFCPGADFKGAWFAFTDFTGVDLSCAGFADVQVKGPCIISLDTLRATSVGFSRKVHEQLEVEFEINPEHVQDFFKSSGVSPADLVLYNQWLNLPREFHSAFISYSHSDATFARSLREALTGFRVPCWMDTWDLYPGETILDAIKRAIDTNDRTLLVCSASSLCSSWVEDEIAMAVEKERNTRQNVLVPIDLDGYLLERWQSGTAPRIRSRLAASFRGSGVVTDRLDELSRIVTSLKVY